MVFKEENQFINEYLKIIKYEGVINKSVEALKEIHKQHLINIPFENLNIINSKDDQYDLLKSKDNTIYDKQYTFTLKERSLEEFKDRCRYFETSEMSRFNKYRLCAKETETGRISLKDYRLLIIDGENILEKPINNEVEFKANLKNLFNIEV